MFRSLPLQLCILCKHERALMLMGSLVDHLRRPPIAKHCRRVVIQQLGIVNTAQSFSHVGKQDALRKHQRVLKLFDEHARPVLPLPPAQFNYKCLACFVRLNGEGDVHVGVGSRMGRSGSAFGSILSWLGITGDTIYPIRQK